MPGAPPESSVFSLQQPAVYSLTGAYTYVYTYIYIYIYTYIYIYNYLANRARPLNASFLFALKRLLLPVEVRCCMSV